MTVPTARLEWSAISHLQAREDLLAAVKAVREHQATHPGMRIDCQVVLKLPSHPGDAASDTPPSAPLHSP